MEACIRWGAHWRNLANTIEASMCGTDATLSNYFYDLLVFMFLALCLVLRVFKAKHPKSQNMGF